MLKKVKSCQVGLNRVFQILYSRYFRILKFDPNQKHFNLEREGKLGDGHDSYFHLTNCLDRLIYYI